MIKSNGDAQTRACIVTSNRIILRHGDLVDVPCRVTRPFPPLSSSLAFPFSFSSSYPYICWFLFHPLRIVFLTPLRVQSLGSHHAKLAISNLDERVVSTKVERRRSSDLFSTFSSCIGLISRTIARTFDPSFVFACKSFYSKLCTITWFRSFLNQAN